MTWTQGPIQVLQCIALILGLDKILSSMAMPWFVMAQQTGTFVQIYFCMIHTSTWKDYRIVTEMKGFLKGNTLDDMKWQYKRQLYKKHFNIKKTMFLTQSHIETEISLT